MKVVKIVLSLAMVAALSYSCSESTEQEVSSTDSVSVVCDSTCVDTVCCKTDSASVDSIK